VHVSNLHPGDTVYVFSTLLGAPIGTADVVTTQADVTVAPLLIKGDKIFAEQKRVADWSVRSRRWLRCSR